MPLSGSLFGRPLAPGRYAVVVEAVRAGARVRIGRVLVTILARDGREGGNRPLLAPDCGGGARTAILLASGGGDFSKLASVSDDSNANGQAGGGSASGGAGGVAGVSAARGDDDDPPLLPELPALPAIPSVPLDNSFDVPPWAFPALAVLGALAAAAFVAFGFRRYRENAGGGWD